MNNSSERKAKKSLCSKCDRASGCSDIFGVTSCSGYGRVVRVRFDDCDGYVKKNSSELNLFALTVGIGIALNRIKEVMSIATSDKMSVATSDEIMQLLSVAEKEAAACLKAVNSEIDRLNP
jgi:hypothetical protein